MINLTIARQRIYAQRLVTGKFERPEDVVRWLGCVQAQEYPGAQWGLGLRMWNPSADVVADSFNAGRILRTHILRPTWHFVLPEDIRWITALTARRVQAFCASYYRQQNLDAPMLARCLDIIVRALEGGNYLTRKALGTALAQAGISTNALQLGFITLYGELEAVLCSGPRQGKQFTYALFDERVPAAPALDRDQALAALAVRYFTSHGPALLRDFAWWSSLTVAETKTGIALAGDQLVKETIDGRDYWRAPSVPPANAPLPETLLLPPFDELTVAYKDHSNTLDPVYNPQAASLPYGGAILLGGEMIGYWKQTIHKGRVSLKLIPFCPLTKTETDTIADAAERYGEFLSLETETVMA